MNNKWYTSVKQIGNNIYVRGYDNGVHFKDKVEYYPTFFVRSKTPTEYKTLHNQYVAPVNPGTIKESRQWLEQYREVEGFDVYGNENSIYQYISDAYPAEIEFDINKIKLVTIDIETTADNGFPDVAECNESVLLITIQDYSTKKIITWGTKPYNNAQSNVKYISCVDEVELLNKFISWWEDYLPEVLTGWNIQYFDIPYLVGRIGKVLGSSYVKKLSPWNVVTQKESLVNNRQQIHYEISGVSQLDYLELYKKFTYSAQESYRLEYIAEVELGETKLDHTEFDTFKDFYTEDWNKFVKYNVIDVELVDKLEDKMKLIELAITMAYDAKVNYADVLYQVRMWDSIIYNYLKQKNVVIPLKVRSEKSDSYAGAYVKEPVPGLYDWVVNFDLNSLYPHLIMQYSISPETLITKENLNHRIQELESALSKM
jgi:DNA polymerase elongation subunit (family B)